MTSQGKIKKTPGDYEVRKGVTVKPVADVEFYGRFLEKLLDVLQEREVASFNSIYVEPFSWSILVCLNKSF